MLAVVNGSRLYVVNRFNGDLLYEKSCKYAPGAGAALSSKHAYVPSLEGLLGAYRVEAADGTTMKPDKAESELTTPAKPQSEAERRHNVSVKQKAPAPVFCQSFGRALVQPLVTRDDSDGEYVVWPTDRGYVNFGRINRDAENSLVVKYRLTTGADDRRAARVSAPRSQVAWRHRHRLRRLLRRIRVRRARGARRYVVAVLRRRADRGVARGD